MEGQKQHFHSDDVGNVGPVDAVPATQRMDRCAVRGTARRAHAGETGGRLAPHRSPQSCRRRVSI